MNTGGSRSSVAAIRFPYRQVCTREPIELTGETRPCELMDDDGRVGLCAALRPDRRGGAYGVLRVGGELRVGMAVEVLADERGGCRYS